VAKRIPQQFGSSSPFSSSVSDRQIHNEFDSIQNKFKVLLGLFNASDRNKFYELQRQEIIPMKPTLLAMLLYVELQNPLLSKYRVDMSEFRKGALYAFDKAYRAISSKELADYIAGETTSCSSHELLKDTMNSTLFNAFTDACKDLRSKRVSSVLTDLTIKNMTLSAVSTRIVPGDVPEGTEFMTDLERAVYKEMEEKASKFWGALAAEEDAAAKLKGGEGAGKQQEKSGAEAGKSTALSEFRKGWKAGEAVGKALLEGKAVPPTAEAAPVVKEPVVPTPTAPAPVVTPAAPTAARVDAVPSAAPAFVMESRPQPATRSALKARSASAAAAASSPTPVPAPAAAAAPVSAPVSPMAAPSSSSSSAHSQSPSTASTAAAQPTNTAAGATESVQAPQEQEADPTVESEAEKEVEREREVELSAYPPGSVVASVVMQFDVHEEYETTMLATEKEKGAGAAPLASVKNARTSSVKWTFRGCISGQVPLQWTVVAFDGVGAANSKY
jgi:hypothetical protein